MATVYKKQNSRYWYAKGCDKTGKRWQRSTHQTDRRAAEQVAARLEQELAVDADRPKDEAYTLEDALTELIAFSKARGRSPHTIEFLETKSRHLVRVLGPKRLCTSVTAELTSRYAQKRIGEGASRHTASFEVRVLLQALRRAAKLKRYRPDGDVRELKPDEVANAYQPRERWLTPGEYRELLGELDPERDGRTRRRRRKPGTPLPTDEDVVALGRLSGREHWDEATARTVLFAWARSGEPMRTFARAHGFAVQRMLWWRERLGVAAELEAIRKARGNIIDRGDLEADRRDYVVVMCQCGVRLGELHRLRAEHVDLRRKTLFIDGKKTGHSRRTVPLTDAAALALAERVKTSGRGPLFPTWKTVTRDLYAACLRIERRMNPQPPKAKRGSGSVLNPKGHPVPKRERERPANPFDPVTPNDLRRTYASWLAQAGVPILHAMKLMGHGSTKMLERVYAQLAPQHLHDAVAMLPRDVTAPVLPSALEHPTVKA